MTEIMILGTFHMKNHNRDFIYGDYQIYEEDIENLIDKLSQFKPTKIAIESNRKNSKKVDEDFTKYKRNDFQLSEDEIHQIGFRLGKRLGLSNINCVDWNDKVADSLSMGDVLERIKSSDKSKLVDELFYDAENFTKKIEEVNNTHSIVEALKYINSEEVISESSWLNNRLINFNLNDEYIGNKWLHGWYVRNLNIVSNILKCMEEENRVLIIYGSSHTKLLKEMLGQHPGLELISPLEYL